MMRVPTKVNFPWQIFGSATIYFPYSFRSIFPSLSRVLSSSSTGRMRRVAIEAIERFGPTASRNPEPTARLAAPGELFQHPAVGAIVLVLFGRLPVERSVVRFGRPPSVQQQPLIVPDGREQPLMDRRRDGPGLVLRQLPDELLVQGIYPTLGED